MDDNELAHLRSKTEAEFMGSFGDGNVELYGQSSGGHIPLSNLPLETPAEALERRVALLEKKVALQTQALKLAAETLREMAAWMVASG